MNPKDPKHLQRLQTAVDWGRHKLEFARTKRLQMVRQYAGGNYSEGGAAKPVYLNMIRLAATILQRQLVPTTPAAMIETMYPQLKSQAIDMTVWMNKRIREIRLLDTLRRGVLDGLFSFAVFKVGLCVYERVQSADGWTHDVGEPYCDLIDVDDWVHDPYAKRWDQIAFCGHRFQMPLEVAQESDYFDKIPKGKLTALEGREFNERGDERIGSIGSVDGSSDQDMEEMVELWEIYLPRDQLVLTFPARPGGGGIDTSEPLRVREFSGPEGGPYHILGFVDVPGQVRPAGPVQDIYDLHLLINTLYRKQADQARQQKTVFAASDVEEADLIRKLDDGQVFRSNNPDAVKPINIPGPDPMIGQFILQAKMYLEYIGGNFPSIGGLGPQSETLGQDKLIHEAGNSIMREMQGRVAGVTKSIYRSMLYYWWTDPVTIYKVERTIPGLGMSFQHEIKPSMRDCNFADLNFDIDPYSQQDDTPDSRLNSLMMFFKEMLLPLLPQLQEQQLQVAFEPLLRKFAQYKNMPDMDGIVQSAAPPQTGGPYQEPPKRGGAGAATTRTYVRKSEGQGMTNQGSDIAQIQSLAAMGRQQQQAQPGGMG